MHRLSEITARIILAFEFLMKLRNNERQLARGCYYKVYILFRSAFSSPKPFLAHAQVDTNVLSQIVWWTVVHE